MQTVAPFVRHLPAAVLARLAEFDALVASWSQRTSLISASTAAQRAEILFRDAVEIQRGAWLSPGTRLLDIGAGVGAPAIPLAVMDPSLTLRLVEPRRLRVAFLRLAIGALDLAARAEVCETRLDDDSAATLAQGCTVAMSRATFAPQQWIACSARLAPACIVFAGAQLPTLPASAQLLHRHSYASAGGGPSRTLLYLRHADWAPGNPDGRLG
ncbi:MAG: RsmG family class I SAM-dependent methyltransferase [Polyangiales bacterium]